jgi:hypothetical protein
MLDVTTLRLSERAKQPRYIIGQSFGDQTYSKRPALFKSETRRIVLYKDQVLS